MELHEKLSDIRTKRYLTQQEVAKAISLSAGSLSAFENGKRVPSRRTLKKMADYYGVDYDSLLDPNMPVKAIKASKKKLEPEDSNVDLNQIQGIQPVNFYRGNYTNKALLQAQTINLVTDLFSLSDFNTHDYNAFMQGLTVLYESLKESAKKTTQ